MSKIKALFAAIYDGEEGFKKGAYKAMAILGFLAVVAVAVLCLIIPLLMVSPIITLFFF